MAKKYPKAKVYDPVKEAWMFGADGKKRFVDGANLSITYLRTVAEIIAALPYPIATTQGRIENERIAYDKHRWIAFYPDLRGCMAEGETETEAREKLAEMKIDHITEMLSFGIEIYPPGDPL